MKELNHYKMTNSIFTNHDVVVVLIIWQHTGQIPWKLNNNVEEDLCKGCLLFLSDTVHP